MEKLKKIEIEFGQALNILDDVKNYAIKNGDKKLFDMVKWYSFQRDVVALKKQIMELCSSYRKTKE